jgi:DNA-binding IscR family transcriptional regulator
MNINLVGYDAVEIMVWLATADRNVTSAELADAIGRSPSSTETLLTRLRSGKLVKSVRGHRLGYRLARPAALISAADVFEAREPGEEPPRSCGDISGSPTRGRGNRGESASNGAQELYSDLAARGQARRPAA